MVPNVFAACGVAASGSRKFSRVHIVRHACYAIALTNDRWGAGGDQDAGARCDNEQRFAVGAFEEVDRADRLARAHILAQRHDVLVDAGLVEAEEIERVLYAWTSV